MRIFYLTDRFPFPLDRGDKIRVFNQIKHLSKNHDIHLFVFTKLDIDQKLIDEMKKYCKYIHIYKMNTINILINTLFGFLKGLPLQVGYFFNKSFYNHFVEYVGQNVPDHIICHMVRTAEYAINLNIPNTIDYQDTMSYSYLRRAGASNLIKRLVYNIEYKRLLKYEKKTFETFTNKVIISDYDLELFGEYAKENMHIIGNGIDTEIFYPRESHKDIDLLYVGSMDYEVNVNCALYIANNIMPEIAKEFKNVKCYIVGTNPPEKVRALANENIIVTGTVDEVVPYYSRAKVFLAPLQIGTGLQNKLLEAMAMKIPVITSALCNKGIKAEDKVHLLIGDKPEDYIYHVKTLLLNDKFRYEMAENAFEFVKSKFVWDKSNEQLEKIIINS